MVLLATATMAVPYHPVAEIVPLFVTEERTENMPYPSGPRLTIVPVFVTVLC